MPASFAFDASGWLSGAEHAQSPNCDARPAAAAVDLIVVHNISLPPGEFGGQQIVDFFCNRLDWTAHPYFETIRELRVSAHFLIARDGRIVQFVSCGERAWHAGQSRFEARERCNDFSVGIELEGADDTPFTESQYTQLTHLIGALRRHYPIRAVVGHADIAPGRKTDPGPAFDWERLAALGCPAELFPFGLQRR